MKKVALSVTEFAVPSPRVGSIDGYSGLSRAKEVGQEIHQRVQAERSKLHPHYVAEVGIKHTLVSGAFLFEVSGRMDGLYSGNKVTVEEIKSSFNIHELLKRLKESEWNHPYCWQLKTYGYFYWLQNKIVPALTLLLVSSRNFETVEYSLKFNIEEYESWLALRLEELNQEAARAEKRSRRRKLSAGQLTFPFERPRPSQTELMRTVTEGMTNHQRMLIQAPTGLGKTVGVLFPVLKEALLRGQRVVYLTPKNSQHSVAEDAVERMRETGGTIRAMTLTAKSKMCFKNEPICNPEFCEYAKNHYSKVAALDVQEQMRKKRALTAKVFRSVAEENQVCPFEIQLDAVEDADVVICDYNYVFAPQSALSRVHSLSVDQVGKPNLVVDEVHNLPARAMDYYSPSISTFILEEMRDEFANLPKRFQIDARMHLESCIQVVKSCAPADCVKPCEIRTPLSKFASQDEDLRTFLSDYLKSDVEIQPNDVVLRLSFYWSQFAETLAYVTPEHPEFFTTFHPNPATIKITCCDASEMLKFCYDDYDQTVGFSATLKPFDYYSRLTGLQSKEIKTAEFVSPFPIERRKVLIIPQISSKFSDRERSYPRIAEAIEKIVSLKLGNYFAFFPSFDFLNRVVNNFKAPQGFTVAVQQRGMGRDDIQNVIEELKRHGSAQITFAVQGGVFSEGIDYPGNLAIGAFIVGPPLPNFDLEREKMKAFYEQHYKAGFDYAYTYPAMAKAIQAAGRVIRSERDCGIIVLMDNRFVQESYSKTMPQDWFTTSARELVSESILADVRRFWRSVAEIPS
jgi:DNA excision repair protein ERCC-2